MVATIQVLRGRLAHTVMSKDSTGHGFIPRCEPVGAVAAIEASRGQNPLIQRTFFDNRGLIHVIIAQSEARAVKVVAVGSPRVLTQKRRQCR